MKLRFKSKLLLAAALGVAFTALAAQAQLLVVNVTQRGTFGPFVGGTNNFVSNNGGTNVAEVITTGTPISTPFSITYNPLVGPSVLDLSMGAGTLNTATFVFNSSQLPQNYFTSVGVVLDTDFESDGIWDLTQSYTLGLSPFTAPNGLSGVNYTIIPDQFFGAVTINDADYSYASVVSNSQGTLFDGSNTSAAIQFQFIATPVPEPSTYALAGMAVLGSIVVLRRRAASQTT